MQVALALWNKYPEMFLLISYLITKFPISTTLSITKLISRGLSESFWVNFKYYMSLYRCLMGGNHILSPLSLTWLLSSKFLPIEFKIDYKLVSSYVVIMDVWPLNLKNVYLYCPLWKTNCFWCWFHNVSSNINYGIALGF